MDHFKVTDHGRLYTLRGKTHPNMMYSGGCIFVDHTMGCVHIKHKINFTATETIQAKKRFEKKMLDMECWCNHINLTMEFLHHWILWKRSTNVCRTSH